MSAIVLFTWDDALLLNRDVVHKCATQRKLNVYFAAGYKRELKV